MPQAIYRYELGAAIPTDEVEATLLLAIVGAESIHGETATQFGVAHYFDVDKRVCVVDAREAVGRDFNSLFAGFLRREFGPEAYRVRRVTSPDTVPAAFAA